MLQFGKDILEKSTSQAIKRKDSDNNCEECMHHENGEPGIN